MLRYVLGRRVRLSVDLPGIRRQRTGNVVHRSVFDFRIILQARTSSIQAPVHHLF